MDHSRKKRIAIPRWPILLDDEAEIPGVEEYGYMDYFRGVAVMATPGSIIDELGRYASTYQLPPAPRTRGVTEYERGLPDGFKADDVALPTGENALLADIPRKGEL